MSIGITYKVVYRLAARPYALSFAMAANSRKQFAVIHHTAASVKRVFITGIYVALESSSANTLVVVDLVRITTAPGTGNPVIIPIALVSSEVAAEVITLALPTIAGTEGVVISTREYDLTKGSAASYPVPSPSLTYFDMVNVGRGSRDVVLNTLVLRAGVLEGYAVIVDVPVATTIKLFVAMELLEF